MLTARVTDVVDLLEYDFRSLPAALPAAPPDERGLDDLTAGFDGGDVILVALADYPIPCPPPP